MEYLNLKYKLKKKFISSMTITYNEKLQSNLVKGTHSIFSVDE